ncbi:MAG: integrase, partial [Burkholderiales bacterium]
MEHYLAGESVRDIHTQTSVGSRQLYRLLERCLARHDDGRVFGYRGLLPHVHVNAYTRHTPLTTLSEAGSRGTAGAFAYCLERYPVLEDWINQ